MSRFLAGIVLLLAPIAAFAQVRGEVESIGFQSRYRPDCWTPIVIKVIPETSKTDMYQIQIRQEDLDRDRAIFTRMISVTGNSDGQVREQRFRGYFIPQPTGRGLPDARDGTQTLKDLDEQLTVNLCTSSGKLIARLPITSSIINVDPLPGMWDTRRGTRFVLAVTEGRSQLLYLDTNATGLLGVTENVEIVMVRPDDLPENVIGYDAIDAVLWLNADPASLRRGGEEKQRALESYISRGGRMVVCQGLEWQKTQQFGELLPVQIEEVVDRDDPRPLRDLARPTRSAAAFDDADAEAWRRLPGPFRVARAQARQASAVDEWVTWPDGTRTPYIARHRHGLGSVTWVAQDLADPAITSVARRGWVYIWDRVFDWRNDPVVLTPQRSERDVPQYAQGLGVDLGASLLSGMELPSKTAWLVTLAIVFFIAYWVVAGPGLFWYLLGRRRAEMNWFAFAAAALVATGLTVAMVRLVLRGPPELRHFSVVRSASDAPAWVHSRFGLYIPRDGRQELTLAETAPGTVSAISAFAIHPAFLQSDRELRGPEYEIPLVDPIAPEPAQAMIPYSSTLKKLQASWSGQLDGRVEGAAALRLQRFIEGNITNGTGRRLRNVYIAFKYPGEGGFDTGDWLLYLPAWEPGATLDLYREFNFMEDGQTSTPFVQADGDNPERGRKVRGKIDVDWAPYWYARLRTGMMGDNRFDDSRDPVRRSLPMLSFFERLPPARNQQQRNDRFELHRRGGRYLDVSHVLAAGSLVVLAEADGSIPLPLHVEGQPVHGEGTILYQFILPLDRSKLEADRLAESVPARHPVEADDPPPASVPDSGTGEPPQRP